jgi:hypothetical protein
VVARGSFSEGTVFAVPLRTGGLATGVLGRAGSSGILFGFFFGPRRKQLPRLESLGDLTPVDAVLIGRFGDLGLRNGRWPVLGTLPNWDRSRWPMPAFARRELITGATFCVIYDDADQHVWSVKNMCLRRWSAPALKMA